MRIIFLLNSLFIFLFSFPSLYNLKSDFEIETTPTTYKLILKNQKFLNYKEIKGFKFFIPKYTKNFSLRILRYNSIGYINGYLSMDNTFSKIIQENDIKYYFTDFKNGFQLTYLLNNYTIPYLNSTSIVIDINNIPSKIQQKLNQYIYFKKIPLKGNKLKFILYSCIIELDKKNVDTFVKTHFKNYLNPINTFISNIYNLPSTTIIKKNLHKKTTIPKKIIKNKRKMPYALILKKLLFMKEYGFMPQTIEIKQPNIYPYLSTLQNNILNLQFFIKNNLNSFIILDSKKIINQIDNKFNNIYKILSNPPQISLNIPKCIFNPNEIKKECFKNPTYFHNYTYFSIKNNSLPNDETILAYGDYKTFNDIGKYYFEIGNFKKAEIFLQKAYILADKKTTISHNLGILYATHSPIYNIKKAIKFFKEANLTIDRYNLGIYYYIGLGVKENDKIARQYFKSALEIPYAKYNYKIMKKYRIGIK